MLIALAGLSAADMGTARAAPLGSFLPDGVRYDGAIPTPDVVLGHGLGERPVRHAAMVDYLTRLAAASDRVTVETIGTSHEGRPIQFFVVTSPENHARLDEIRAAHLARLSGAADAPEADADAPLVLWINYGVHGAESSAMDAAIPALYHYAAAQSDAVEAQLRNSVILFTAVFNPDGNVRRIDHVDRFGGTVPVTDPFHIQHDLWIEARTNHYWFDLNRQWLLLTQPESTAWISQWHKWKPNVTNDYHEMGSEATYYFHPGTPTRLNPLIPDEARVLAGRIAAYHARELDEDGTLYFSEELFDNFYIGKGSTYPQVNGSIGFLYEAGAARGGRIETRSGERTYAQNIHRHFRTTLSSVEGALANREGLLAYQRSFFQDAVSSAGTAPVRAWVFSAGADHARAAHFVEMLRGHDIRVHRLARDLRVGEQRFSADSAYVVPVDQPQHVMIRGIFESVTEFEEAVFYDVSGWTMPLAYGLTYAGLGRPSYQTTLLGAEAEADWPVFAAPRSAPYGYVFDWSGYYAPRALARVLEAGILARVAFEPTRVETANAGARPFGRGAIFVPQTGQTVAPAEIAAVMATITAEDGVEVYGVTSGLTPDAGRDLGAARSFRPVAAPSVLLLFGEGLNFYDTGEAWHLLDHRMQMPVTMARPSALARADWSRYTHIILSGGTPRFSEPVLERLHQWIREEGGTVMASGDAAIWAQNTLLMTADEAPTATPDPSEPPAAPQRYDYAELQLRSAEHIIGGTIFASDLDPSHPLGFGYEDRFLATMRRQEEVLTPPYNPVATVARYTDEPLLSGYASARRQAEIANTPMAVAERVGSGTVVLYADNLNFRGTFFGTSKLFLNGLFFAPLIDTPLYEQP